MADILMKNEILNDSENGSSDEVDEKREKKLAQLTAFNKKFNYQRPDKKIKLSLDNEDLWNKFNGFGTEMIITKSGRRMFPTLKVNVKGLKPDLKYFFLMDIVPLDDCRYKYHNSEWAVSGKAEIHFSTSRIYIHPDSPATGEEWMKQSIAFHKIKLTNNNLDQNGHIILNSMHKYIPRIHVIQCSDLVNISWEDFNTFIFEQSSFIAVTAYQNEQITQLKIDNNPFAKGFRENGLSKRDRSYLNRHNDEYNSDEMGDAKDDSEKEFSTSVKVKTEPKEEHEEPLSKERGTNPLNLFKPYLEDPYPTFKNGVKSISDQRKSPNICSGKTSRLPWKQFSKLLSGGQRSSYCDLLKHMGRLCEDEKRIHRHQPPPPYYLDRKRRKLRTLGHVTKHVVGRRISKIRSRPSLPPPRVPSPSEKKEVTGPHAPQCPPPLPHPYMMYQQAHPSYFPFYYPWNLGPRPIPHFRDINNRAASPKATKDVKSELPITTTPTTAVTCETSFFNHSPTINTSPAKDKSKALPTQPSMGPFYIGNNFVHPTLGGSNLNPLAPFFPTYPQPPNAYYGSPLNHLFQPTLASQLMNGAEAMYSAIPAFDSESMLLKMNQHFKQYPMHALQTPSIPNSRFMMADHPITKNNHNPYFYY